MHGHVQRLDLDAKSGLNHLTSTNGDWQPRNHLPSHDFTQRGPMVPMSRWRHLPRAVVAQ